MSIKSCVLALLLASPLSVFGQTRVTPTEPPPALPSASHTAGSELQSPETTPALKTRNSGESDIKIGSGDLLDMSMYGVPEFASQSRVSADGDVAVPVLGSVHVAGLTVLQAQTRIREELVKQQLYTDPHVTVSIKEYATQGVTVMGEVNKPGVYPRLGPQRVLDVISEAGGFTAKAGNQIAISHRGQSDAPVLLQLSNDPQTAIANNAQILPGDTVIVSRAGIVYVVGDVTKPGGFVMDNDGSLTVLQAMALAGGANRTASLGKARLIRKEQGSLQEVHVELEKILQAKAEDLAMHNGDILFVPNSAWKSASRRGLEAILQTATGVAIYRPY